MHACPPRAQVRHLGRMRIVSVTCGSNHTLAISEAGELLACGRGRHGQLGQYNFRDQASLRHVDRLACAPCLPVHHLRPIYVLYSLTQHALPLSCYAFTLRGICSMARAGSCSQVTQGTGGP